VSELVNSLAENLPAKSGDSWLANLKARGRSQFTSVGLPDKKVEEWKYTSLLALEQRKTVLGTSSTSSKAVYKPKPLADITVQISMLDGEFVDISGKAAGVRIQSLRTVLQDNPEEIKDLLQSLEIDQRGQGFSALNTATLDPGVVIHVASEVNAGEILLQWNSSASLGAELFNSRVVLVLEKGAKLHLLEQFENRSEDSSVLNVVVQCKLEESSELTLTRLQDQSASSVLITRTDVSQSNNSYFRFTALDLGTGLVRHDVKADLSGQGASCALNGACVGSGQSHVDHHLYANHIAGDCKSSQLFRAVAKDRSRVVFNGKVHVFKGADGSDAKQSSAGLLLSKLAEIDTKPELEIYADEVIASHGATVGQLDDQALFYMQSRGLSEQQATNLLTMAFCRSVTDQLPSDSLRETLGERLSRALEGAVEHV